MTVGQRRELGSHAKLPVTSFSRRKGPVQRARESLEVGTPRVSAQLQAIQPRVIPVAQVPRVGPRLLVPNGVADNDLASKLAARRRLEESASGPSAPQAGDTIPKSARSTEVETSHATEQDQRKEDTDHDARKGLTESASGPSAPQAGDTIPKSVRATGFETSHATEQDQREEDTDHEEPEEPPDKFVVSDSSGSDVHDGGSSSGSDVHDGGSSDSGDHIAC